MKEFNSKIRKWCSEPEFTEIYKINHPTENINEVHFIRNGIRVCCVKNFSETYFYLNAECYLRKEKEILTLKTGKEPLFDTKKRDDLLALMKSKINTLENKRGLLYFFRRHFFMNKFS